MTEIDPICAADFERCRKACKEGRMTEIVGPWTRILEITPGYDHMTSEFPCIGGKSHGRHGMEMGFILVGPRGAIRWTMSAMGWHPGKMSDIGGLPVRYHALDAIMPMYLSYHSPWPVKEWQTTPEKCEYIPGGECYSDGSGLQAEYPLLNFLEDGLPGVWTKLGSYYELWLPNKVDS